MNTKPNPRVLMNTGPSPLRPLVLVDIPAQHTINKSKGPRIDPENPILTESLGKPGNIGTFESPELIVFSGINEIRGVLFHRPCGAYLSPPPPNFSFPVSTTIIPGTIIRRIKVSKGTPEIKISKTRVIGFRNKKFTKIKSYKGN